MCLLAVAIALSVSSSADGRPRCDGHKATIVGGKQSNRIHGTGSRDVIVGGRGNDLIVARGGRDIVCGGPGRDSVVGGSGRDQLHGGSGSDRLFGGQQDDTLEGESGDDLLVDIEGYDTLRGGGGNDLARGGFRVDGGPGSDWISFATDTSGLGHYGLTPGTQNNRRQRNVENVVGTRFADTIIGGPAAVNGEVRGLGFPADARFPFLVDQCFDFAVTDCGSGYPADQPIVLLDPTPPDPGVTVVGSAANESFGISLGNGALRVDGPGSLAAGPGCRRASSAVSCPLPGGLSYLLVLASAGDDQVTLSGAFGPTTTTVIDGGPGSDAIRGGAGNDYLYAGDEFDRTNVTLPQAPPSADTLSGGGGDDSLLGGNLGPERLEGGRGTDQLATWDPCAGGVFDGGAGRSDIADFAFASEVKAKLGGTAVVRERGSDPCSPTHLAESIELMEGTSLDDILIGDNRRNSLIVGHEGNDVIKGLGGNDRLFGERGHDTLTGGGGSDLMDCGPDGGRAHRDRLDPSPHHCS